jgi:hypothetical protein
MFGALSAFNQSRCSPPLSEDEVRKIAQSIARYPPAESDDTGDASDDESSIVWSRHHNPSQATLLVQLVREDIELFHDTDRVPYASIPTGGHWETWPVASKSFKDYLTSRYYGEHQNVPRASAMTDAISQLEGRAIFDGDMRPVAMRTALHEGAIIIDLGGDDWRSVVVTRTGWEIVESSPVRFRRTNTTRPLPEPIRGSDLATVGAYANVAGGAMGDDFMLLVGFMIAALLPSGPYPILDLSGEQGGGKSTTARVIRRLTDPRNVEIASMPRDERDLASAARNNRLLIFDNVSYISDDRADALCRLATGGGWQSRKLYTDDEEHAIDAMCPVVLTGIPDLATRSDLADRTITLEIPALPRARRQTEQQFWTAFERDASAMFGALLDVLVTSLANRDSVSCDTLPRMADFATLGEAMLSAFDREPGAFLAAMARNQERQNSIILEAHPEVIELMRWLEDRTDHAFCGTASDLLAALSNVVDGSVTRSKDWPKSPKALSTTIRRVKPNLKHAGWLVSFTRDRHNRMIEICRTETIGETVSPASSSSPDGPFGDAGDTGDAQTLLVSGATNGKATSWVCPECGTQNAAHVTVCFGCIRNRQDSTRVESLDFAGRDCQQVGGVSDLLLGDSAIARFDEPFPEDD